METATTLEASLTVTPLSMHTGEAPAGPLLATVLLNANADYDNGITL